VIAPDEVDDALGFTHEIIGLLHQLAVVVEEPHVDEDVAGIELPGLLRLLPAFDLGHLLGRHQHFVHVVLHLLHLDELVDVAFRLGLLIGEALHGVPPGSG
jgi:hypothetical protein